MTQSRLVSADDETLAFAARQGDHLAFAELYRRYCPVFVAYAERRLRGEGADVVQAAFLSIFRGLARYKGPRFFSWAFRICVNAVTDELRKKKVRAACAGAGPAELRGDAVASPAGNPEEELIAKQLSDRVSGALQRLPASQRAVFALARIEGLDYAEISDLLGIPVGTVKSRMFKAVRALFGKGDPR